MKDTLKDKVYDLEIEMNDMGFWEWFVPNAPDHIKWKFSKYVNFVFDAARDE